MNMLKIDALVQCRSHWQWIYDNTERLMSKNLLITPEEIKFAYFEKNYPYSIPDTDCFCCEYDSQYKPETMKEAMKVCSHCCLVWGDESESGVGIIHCLESFFAEWLQCEDNLAERTKLAEQIRDLPVREDA